MLWSFIGTRGYSSLTRAPAATTHVKMNTVVIPLDTIFSFVQSSKIHKYAVRRNTVNIKVSSLPE